MIGEDSRGRARARACGRAPRCTRTRFMVGDDSRGRARAPRCTRTPWLGITRAGARARATVHKNTMIEDDAHGRARAGVTMHKNFKKVKIPKSIIFRRKNRHFCTTDAGMEFADSSSRLFILTFYAQFSGRGPVGGCLHEIGNRG